MPTIVPHPKTATRIANHCATVPPKDKKKPSANYRSTAHPKTTKPIANCSAAIQPEEQNRLLTIVLVSQPKKTMPIANSSATAPPKDNISC